MKKRFIKVSHLKPSKCGGRVGVVESDIEILDENDVEVEVV